MIILITLPIDPLVSQLQIYIHFSCARCIYGLCHVHFIFRLLVSLILLDEEYKLWSISQCNLFQSSFVPLSSKHSPQQPNFKLLIRDLSESARGSSSCQQCSSTPTHSRVELLMHSTFYIRNLTLRKHGHFRRFCLHTVSWVLKNSVENRTGRKAIAFRCGWLGWYPCGRLKPATRISPQPTTPKLQHTSKQEHTTNVVIQ